MRPTNSGAVPILGVTGRLLFASGLLLLSSPAIAGPDCLDYATKPPDPILGSVDVSSFQTLADLAVAGGHAYITAVTIVTEPNGELFVTDVSDPTNPHVVGSHYENLFMGSVASDGRYAYLLAFDEYTSFLQVVAVTQPTAPVLVAQKPSEGRDLALVEDLLYLADNSLLEIIDVSNPTTPVTIGTLTAPMGVFNVAVAGNYAYLTGFVWPPPSPGALFVVDVSDPTAPALVGTLVHDNDSNFGAAAVRGNLAVVGTSDYPGPSEILVIDISDPAAPALAARVPASVVNVAFDNAGTLYAFGGHELYIYDVSNPTQPNLIGSTDSLGAQWGVPAVVDPYVYLMTSPDGYASRLDIVPVQCPVATSVPQIAPAVAVTLHAARPNPFRGRTSIHYELTRPEVVRLRVYDLQGRIVRRLEDGVRKDAGAHRVVWDGLNEVGRQVGSGVYFVGIDFAGTAAGPDERGHQAGLRLTLLE